MPIQHLKIVLFLLGSLGRETIARSLRQTATAATSGSGGAPAVIHVESRAIQALVALDSNRDGRLQKEELLDRKEGLGQPSAAQFLGEPVTEVKFSSLDSNKDGAIDIVELDEAMKEPESRPQMEVHVNVPGISDLEAPLPSAMGATASSVLETPLQAEVATAAQAEAGDATEEAASHQEHMLASEVFAQKLSLRENKLAKALELERTAAEERAKAQSLASAARERILQLGAAAAHEKAAALVKSVVDLEEEAVEVESRAAAAQTARAAEAAEAYQLMNMTRALALS